MSTPSGERSRRSVLWLLAPISVWLWLAALWAWQVDAPSAQYILQNLGARTSAVALWLTNWHLWLVVGCVAVGGLLAWRTRSRAVWASLALVLPGVLLSLWYVTAERPTRSAVVRHLQQQTNQQDARRAPADFRAEARSAASPQAAPAPPAPAAQ